jgi:hypothetical protein
MRQEKIEIKDDAVGISVMKNGIKRSESLAPLRMNISAGSFCVEGSQKIVYM